MKKAVESIFRLVKSISNFFCITLTVRLNIHPSYKKYVVFCNNYLNKSPFVLAHESYIEPYVIT